MSGSIITVATMKGGSGKSTLASCLAVHWQLDGRRPAIIDADPQRSIARLAARSLPGSALPRSGTCTVVNGAGVTNCCSAGSGRPGRVISV